MISMMDRAYIRIRTRMNELVKQIKDEEDGMQTLETVILIIVAVIVAGTVVTLLTGSGGEDKGLLGKITGWIEEKFKSTFSVGSNDV